MPGTILASIILLFVALTASYLAIRRLLTIAAGLVSDLEAGEDRYDQGTYGDIPSIPAGSGPHHVAGAPSADPICAGGYPFTGPRHLDATDFEIPVHSGPDTKSEAQDHA